MNLSEISLASERLLVATFAPADAEECYSVQTSTLTRFMSWDPEPSLDAFAQVWHGWHQEHVAGTKVEFAIRLKETGEYLGTAGLHEIEAVEPETGIWIKEVCQGHGFGFEALSTVIAFAARDLGKETLTYHVAEKNVASCRLAENLGGEIVGRKVLEKSDGTKFSGLIYRLSASAVEHRSRRKC